MGMAVAPLGVVWWNHQGLSGGTATFYPRLAISVVERGGHRMVMVVHRPKILEAGDLEELAWVVTATPMAMHRP